LNAAKIATARTSSKPLKTAFATLLLKYDHSSRTVHSDVSYAVLFSTKSDANNAIPLLNPAVKVPIPLPLPLHFVTDGQLLQDTAADSEALFRALVALGTALSVDNDEVKAAASQIFGVKEALQDVKKRQSENRIKQVISEIEGFLS
jgi:PUL domain